VTLALFRAFLFLGFSILGFGLDLGLLLIAAANSKQ
jgi:hypothetical protein